MIQSTNPTNIKHQIMLRAIDLILSWPEPIADQKEDQPQATAGPATTNINLPALLPRPDAPSASRLKGPETGTLDQPFPAQFDDFLSKRTLRVSGLGR